MNNIMTTVKRFILNALPRRIWKYTIDANSAVTMDCLMLMKEKKGFTPKRIIDVGAHIGAWTRSIKKVFPDAHVLMIEPQADKDRALRQVKMLYPMTVDYAMCLLGAERKEAILFYSLETGSSVLKEQSNVPSTMITLPMRMLDDVARERGFDEASLLKLDVQGYELEVLKGGTAVLKNADVVMIEASFLAYNQDAPFFHDVIAFMKERGFIVYDIGSLYRWFRDETLMQADFFFVKESSPWRPDYFAY